MNTRLKQWIVMATAAVLAACGGGGGDGGSASTGTMRLAITDAPACGYESVFVTVRVHQAQGAADGDAGWSELVLSPPRRVDLLTLTNGVLSELGQMTLPAGKYTQLRLVLADNGGGSSLANAVIPEGGAVLLWRRIGEERRSRWQRDRSRASARNASSRRSSRRTSRGTAG